MKRLLIILIACFGLNSSVLGQWPSLNYYKAFKVQFCLGGTVETFYNVDADIIRRYRLHIGQANSELDCTGDGLVTNADVAFLLSLNPSNTFTAPQWSCLTWNGTNYTNGCGSILNLATGCGGVSYLPMWYNVSLQPIHATVSTTSYGAGNFKFIYVR